MRLLVVVVCVVWTAPPVVWCQRTELELREREAGVLYREALRLAADGKYRASVARLDRLLDDYPDFTRAAAAREHAADLRAQRFPREPLSGGTKTSLVTFGTLFPTWAAVGILIIADVEESEPAGMVVLVVPAVGVATTRSYVRRVPWTEGQGSLVSLAGRWGIWQGAGAAAVADANEKASIAASIAGGAIGWLGATELVKRRDFSAGDASLINLGGMWGTWLALCGARAADVDDSDSIILTAMVAGDVGIVTMAWAAPRLDMSRARTRLINLGGVVGTLYGFGVSILRDVDDGSVAWRNVGIGSVVGLAVGAYLTRNWDREQGYFRPFAHSADSDAPVGLAARRTAPSLRVGRSEFAGRAHAEPTVPLVSARF
ncbi:hypothetical protein FJZ36_13395 [Candidatus Poribacteria bacterium]|nr:hypothetical protein [Candidatus Poribacteria bacterium]